MNWVVNDDSLERAFPRNLLLHAWKQGWTADLLQVPVQRVREHTVG